MEMPDVMLVMGILSTVMTLYGMKRWMDFKCSENRKKREHQKDMKKMEYAFKTDERKTNTAKATENIGERLLGGEFGNIGDLIQQYVGGGGDEDALVDMGVPEMLAPAVQGFIQKYIEGMGSGKKNNKDEEPEGF